MRFLGAVVTAAVLVGVLTACGTVVDEFTMDVAQEGHLLSLQLDTDLPDDTVVIVGMGRVFTTPDYQYLKERPTTAYGRYHCLRVVARQALDAPRSLDSRSVMRMGRRYGRSAMLALGWTAGGTVFEVWLGFRDPWHRDALRAVRSSPGRPCKTELRTFGGRFEYEMRSRVLGWTFG